MLPVGENIEMYEYKKEILLFVCLFVCFMAVLLLEAQTEIPISLHTHWLSSCQEDRSRGKIVSIIHCVWEGNHQTMLILPVLFMTSD